MTARDLPPRLEGVEIHVERVRVDVRMKADERSDHVGVERVDRVHKELPALRQSVRRVWVDDRVPTKVAS